MPYIVILNMPGYLPEQDPYAVATIEEARQAAIDGVDRSYTFDMYADAIAAGETLADEEAQLRRVAAELPDSGGIVGPVPGGYVIDVQHQTWPQLAALVGMVVSDRIADVMRSDLLDTYNDR